MVHNADCTTRVFKPYKKGQFFIDVKKDFEHTGQILISTVDNNKTKYTIKEYSDAVHAHTNEDIIGQPSTGSHQYIEDNLRRHLQDKDRIAQGQN